jgi:hypothetical protein
VVLTPLDKLEIGLSALNLGRINWNHAPYQLQSQGSFTFSGWKIDMQDSVSWAGWEADMEGLLDSLGQTFEPVGSGTAFRQALPATLLLTAQYRPLPFLRLGASIQGTRYLRRWQQQTNLYAGVEWAKWGSVGATYGYHSLWRHQLGLQGRLNLGPVQLYLLSGNLLALAQPLEARSFSASLGLNLTFGRLDQSTPAAGKPPKAGS